MRWIWAVPAALALLSPAAAAAGEARCLWRALAPATQDRLLATYAQKGMAGVIDARLEPAEARRQMSRCAELGGVVDPKRAVRAMGVALEGWVVQQGAIRALAGRTALTEEQLNAAWAGLGPVRRAQLHAHAEKMVESRSQPEKWSADVGMLFADFLLLAGQDAAAGPIDPELTQQLLSYLAGRSSQEAFEPRF